MSNDLLKLSVRNSALQKVRNYESDGEISPITKPRSNSSPVAYTQISRYDLSMLNGNISSETNTSSSDYSPIESNSSPKLEDTSTIDFTPNSEEQEEEPETSFHSLSEIREEQTKEKDIEIEINNKTESEQMVRNFNTSIDHSRGDNEFEEAINKLAMLFGENIESKVLSNDSKMDNLRINLNEFSGVSPNNTDLIEKEQALGPLWDSVAPNIKSRMQRSITAFRETLGYENNEEVMKILNKVNKSVRDKEKKELTDEKWNELLQRLNRPFEKKARKIEEILQEREMELQKYTFRPRINKKSKQLIPPSSKLDDRVNSFLSEKEKNIERRKMVIDREVGKTLTFAPRIEKRSKELSRDVDLLLNWKEEKQKKLHKLRIKIENDKVSSCTFKPEVLEKSTKIAEKFKKRVKAFGLSQTDDVFERNYEWEFIKNFKKQNFAEEVLSKERLLRSPCITPKASSLIRKESFGERLYKQALESLEKKEKKRIELSESIYMQRLGINRSDNMDPYFGDDDNNATEEDNLSLDQIKYLVSTSNSNNKKVEEKVNNVVKENDNTNNNNKISTVNSSDPYVGFTSRLKGLSLFDYSDDEDDPQNNNEVLNLPSNEKYSKTIETLKLFHKMQQGSRPSTPNSLE